MYDLTPNEYLLTMYMIKMNCSKRVVVSQMYDLTVKESPGYPSGKPGCSREDDICGVNSIQRSFCGKNRVCEATWNPDSYICVCKPTYRGRQCEIGNNVKSL